MVPRRIVLLAATVALLSIFMLVGCGGGGNASTGPVPVPPTFMSTPGTAAEQGMQYSYQVEASVASGGGVSFALTAAPTGAVLTGNTVTWTPTAAQSRISNSFTVTASSAGGSANQSWTVTPNGTITVSFIETYWTSSGSVQVQESLQPGLPVALIPQANGSLMTIPLASASNGVFTITNVPAGNYWLELGPGTLFWTNSSTFDFGGDEVGALGQSLATSQDTSFLGTFAGLDSVQAADWFGTRTNMHDAIGDFPATVEAPVGSTTLDFSTAVLGTEDLSPIKSIFFAEYEPPAPSVPNALVMGPELTLSNVTVTNNTSNNITNNVTDNLNASPQASIGLSIQGTDWANAAGSMAPAGSATPFTSALILAAQPFVTGRNAVPMGSTLGPNIPLITAEPPSTGPFASVSCDQRGSFVLQVGFPTSELFIQSPVLSNQDFGTVAYGDPFPTTWPRVFYFCQGFMVPVQIPGSSTTQSFYIQNGEISQPPTAAVVPLLSPVQNPQINGASLLTPVTLSTGNVTLSWNSPATGQPFGYYIQVFEPEMVNSVLQYSLSGQLGVTVNSINLPPLGSGTYIFMISAVADGVANMQASPRRSALPTAFVDVLSAPITINSSGSSSAAYYKANAGTQSLTNEQRGQSPSCLLPLGNPACPPKFSIRH